MEYVKLIGVSGKKRSGKDLFYQYFNSSMQRNYAMRRYAFADAVKEFAGTYFGYPLPETELSKEKFRYILQGIGEMMRHEVDEFFWVRKVQETISADSIYFKEKNIPFIAVITDVRYTNEADWVRDEGGVVLRINRSPFQQNTDAHPSETSLDNYNKFDYEIHNASSKEEYRRMVEDWVRIWQQDIRK